MEFSHLLAFAAVGLAAVMVPGPDFAVVTGTALRHGRRSGFRAAAGIAVGLCGWGLVTALGLAAVVAQSAIAFTVIKMVGGAYLLYLGIKALLSVRHIGKEMVGDAAGIKDETESPVRTGFTQGLLTNLFNPKAGLFFLTLLPQFAGPNPTFFNIATLAVLQALIALAWFSFYAAAVSAIRPLMRRRRSRQVLEGVTGFAFVGVGVRLVLSRS